MYEVCLTANLTDRVDQSSVSFSVLQFELDLLEL